VRIEAKLGLVVLKVEKAESQTSLSAASRSIAGVRLGATGPSPAR
jgi:hypothetical protein